MRVGGVVRNFVRRAEGVGRQCRPLAADEEVLRLVFRQIGRAEGVDVQEHEQFAQHADDFAERAVLLPTRWVAGRFEKTGGDQSGRRLQLHQRDGAGRVLRTEGDGLLSQDGRGADVDRAAGDAGGKRTEVATRRRLRGHRLKQLGARHLFENAQRIAREFDGRVRDVGAHQAAAILLIRLRADEDARQEARVDLRRFFGGRVKCRLAQIDVGVHELEHVVAVRDEDVARGHAHLSEDFELTAGKRFQRRAVPLRNAVVRGNDGEVRLARRHRIERVGDGCSENKMRDVTWFEHCAGGQIRMTTVAFREADKELSGHQRPRLPNFPGR